MGLSRYSPTFHSLARPNIEDLRLCNHAGLYYSISLTHFVVDFSEKCPVFLPTLKPCTVETILNFTIKKTTIYVPCLCLLEFPLDILAPYSLLCHDIAVSVRSMGVCFVRCFVGYILDCLHTCSYALLMVTAGGHWQSVPS